MTCKYKYTTADRVCRHPVDGQESGGLCIFHSQKSPGKYEQFLKDLAVLIDETEARDSSAEYYDFEGFVFRETNFSGKVFSKPANFQRCKFGDYANFQNCVFTNNTNFRYSEFGDHANFQDSIFGDHTNFQDGTFGNHANFWKIKFGNNTNFRGRQFGIESRFWESVFGTGASFWKSVFSSDANFSRADFGDRAEFGMSTFGENAQFCESSFGKFANFSKSNFGTNADFSKSKFDHKARFLENTMGNGAIFDSCEFSGDTLFQSSVFKGGASFEKCKIDGQFEFFEVKLKGIGKFNEIAGSGTLLLSSIVAPESGAPLLQFRKTKSITGRIFLNDFSLTRTSFLLSHLEAFHFGSVSWHGRIDAPPWDRKRKILTRKIVMYFGRDFRKGRSRNNRIMKNIRKFLMGKTLFQGLNHIRAWKTKRKLIIWDETRARPFRKEENANVEDLYTQLRRMFDAAKKYAYADACHYGELEMRRLSQGRIARHLGWEAWYKRIADYGMNWIKPISWAIGIWFLLILPGYAEALHNSGRLAYLTYCCDIFFLPEIKVVTEYYFRNSIFAPVKQLEVGPIALFSSFLSKLLVPVCFGFSVFAVRRKFRF